jgi:hypothetical protein
VSARARVPLAVALRRAVARPSLVSAFVLEPVRAEGRSVTLVLTLSGRGVVVCGGVREPFDATRTAGGTCRMHMPVVVGATAVVRVRGLLHEERHALLVAPTAPRAVPPRIDAASWSLPRGVTKCLAAPAAALPKSPDSPRIPGTFAAPRVALAPSIVSLRLRRDRLSPPRDPS